MTPRIRRAFSIAAAAMLTGALSMTAAFAQGKPDIRIATGRQGGAYYNMGALVADALYRSGKVSSATAESASGGIEGLRLADKGTVQLAAADKVWVLRARNGEKPFEKKLDIVTVAPLGVWQLFFVTQADSPIKSLKDFAGKKINIAPKGFSVTELGLNIFDMIGLKGKVDIGYLAIGSAVEAFKDGHVDGLMYLPSDRFGPFINLAQTRKIRLVPIGEPVLDKLLKNPSAFRTKFPKIAGVYKNLSNSVDTLGYANVVVGSKTRLSDAQAYAIVKAVAENFDKVRAGDPSLQDFDPKNMAQQTGAPFHPGALKYYRERGWIK